MKTKGATSFVAIRLSQLNKILKDDAMIMVSKKQMNAYGILGEAINASEIEKNPAAAPVEEEDNDIPIVTRVVRE